MQSSEIEYGETPVYNGTTDPEKASTAEYSYKFIGWDSDIAPVTAAKTYTAQFDAEKNKYLILFVNGGDVLQSSEIAYGEMPTYNGDADPTKEATAELTYTFSGWTPEIVAVTGEATYTAQFTATKNKYEVSFSDGSRVIYKIPYSYGEIVEYSAPSESFIKPGYTFAGWDMEFPFTMPAEDVIVIAQWEANLYTITLDLDGGTGVTEIKTSYGSAIDKPADPRKEGYEFIGWNPQIPETMPLEGTTCKAQWKEIGKVSISFVSGTTEVTAPDAISGIPGENLPNDFALPTLTGWTGHTFKGWDKTLPSSFPDEDMTITAVWEINDDTGKPTVVSVTINEIDAINAPNAVECISSANVVVQADDDLSGVKKTEYVIDGTATEFDGSFTIDTPGEYIITITATDNAGNTSDPVEIKTVVRDEATLNTKEYTYTQLSGKDVALEGLDLHGATIDKITIGGTNIWNADKNALDSEILDNFTIGGHTAKIFTKLNGESHDTGIEFTIDIKGFEVDFEIGEREDGYCPGEMAEITLTFKNWTHSNTPNWYKIGNGNYQQFESLEALVAKLALDIPEESDGKFMITFKLDKNSNTESEEKTLPITVNGSRNYIIKLFDDIIAIDNHDDLFTSFQWYKDGKKIDGADQQYYQVDGTLNGIYSAYVTKTDGSTMKICSVDMTNASLSKSLRRSVNAYPNPARAGEEITLELINFDQAEYDGCVIKIVNNAGAVVATITNCDRINTVSLPLGSYTGYVIRNGAQDKVSFKLIVK